MSSLYNSFISISTFGESHGKAVGVVVDGFPAGVKFDQDYIQEKLNRRKPSSETFSTKRKESDVFRVVSGVVGGYTAGSPICMIIENHDAKPNDYIELPFRPSHADYTASLRYKNFSAKSGGGHFSGRITSALVMAGALCELYLKTQGVKIDAHTFNIGGVFDKPYDSVSGEFPNYSDKVLRVIDIAAAEKMHEEIKCAWSNTDSVGGSVECMATGVKAGLGSPNMCGVENRISSLLFAVPAVKAVEFGAGFNLCEMRGSKANDSFINTDGSIKTQTNNSGGINGGITNGMPVVFRAGFRPTPSIAAKQHTVDKDGNKTEICIKGRHDPCIVPRAVPVVESVMAIVLADLYLEAFGYANA